MASEKTEFKHDFLFLRSADKDGMPRRLPHDLPAHPRDEGREDDLMAENSAGAAR